LLAKPGKPKDSPSKEQVDEEPDEVAVAEE